MNIIPLPPAAVRTAVRELHQRGAHWLDAEDLQQAFVLHQLERAAGRHSPGPLDPVEWLAYQIIVHSRTSRAGVELDPDTGLEGGRDPLAERLAAEDLEAQAARLKARRHTAAGFLAEVLAGRGDVKANADLILRLTGSRAGSIRSKIRRAQQIAHQILEDAMGPQLELDLSFD